MHFHNSLNKMLQNESALRLIRVEVNRVRANGEGMGCTQRELQQPCSVQAQGVTAINHFVDR